VNRQHTISKMKMFDTRTSSPSSPLPPMDKQATGNILNIAGGIFCICSEYAGSGYLSKVSYLTFCPIFHDMTSRSQYYQRFCYANVQMGHMNRDVREGDSDEEARLNRKAQQYGGMRNIRP